MLADLGAYLLPSTPIPPHTTAMLLAGCYDIQNVEVFVTGARTNKVPTAPYRGAGRPEASYLIETAIDQAARAAAHRPGRAAPPQPGPRVPLPDGARLDLRLRRLRALPGPRAGADRRSRRRAARTSRTGIGVALSVERSGGLYEYAEVTRDGDVTSRSARSPPARATRPCSPRSPPTKLGIDPAQRHRPHGDTDAIARRRRLLRQPHDRDGRLGRRRRGRRPARRRATGAPASSPTRCSRAAPTPRPSRSTAPPGTSR